MANQRVVVRRSPHVGRPIVREGDSALLVDPQHARVHGLDKCPGECMRLGAAGLVMLNGDITPHRTVLVGDWPCFPVNQVGATVLAIVDRRPFKGFPRFQS